MEAEFLTREEELLLKSRFIILKKSNLINPLILEKSIKLNSIEGFVIVDSDINEKSSFIAVKFTEDFTYPITESIHKLVYEDSNVTVEWNTHINFIYLNENQTVTNVTIIRGFNIDIFTKLISYLID